MYIYIYIEAAMRVSLFHLRTKTSSEDEFPEDELRPEDEFPPEDELRRRITRRRIALKTNSTEGRGLNEQDGSVETMGRK